MTKLKALINGKIILQTQRNLSNFVRGVRQQKLTPAEELEVWREYGSLSSQLFNKSKFSPKQKIANGAERRRRWTFFALFHLFKFRSRDVRIRAYFQQHFGPLSLQWFATGVGTLAPNFYYEWAFKFLPVSLRTFGPQSVKPFLDDPEYMASFKKILPRAVDKVYLSVVKETMES